MKKILLSLSTIAAVAVLAVVGTTAYFTDEEKSTGNTFTAGTIDIAVDGQNPWQKTETLNVVDMKPSQHEYTEYVIQNVGTNPANVWKRIDVTSETDNIISEPECVFGNGTWSNGQCTNYTPENDISTAIRYDMSVWVYDVDPTTPGAQPKWWQVIYTDEMGKMLSTVNGQDILLGMIPEGWYMKVQQSYHMDEDTGNWAQGDKLTFDITLKAEQLKGVVEMENKDFANQQNPTLVHDDGISGTLTYGVKDAKFDFSFTGKAPLANTGYSLIFYPETYSSPVLNAPTWPRDVIILGTSTTAGDKSISITGSKDFGYDILNMKVWLVETNDLNGSTFKNVWNGNDYLFELGLMDYYDSL